ncbi:Ras-like small GTPase [Novymonas esmeraldas]|uniref:Ras-like small GTPase n=1 Tax=Novymonas esmeraldas TaxID=1808958 RepID=A0AAW0F8J4_9TRYP
MTSAKSCVAVDDADDFTYTEDPSGEQVKVPVATEYVFKVVVIGDYSVGKTSIIKRLLALPASSLSLSGGHHNGNGSDLEDSGNDSDEDGDGLAAVVPTVGTDFYSLSVPDVVPGASVRLQMWDTAGLEKYAAKYENTFRNASFVICVFDVTSAASLHNVVERHLSIAAEHVPELDQSNIMVVANKIDIVADVANNTTALRDARKRARSPETAFGAANDEDTATNTDDEGSTSHFTSADGVAKDALVTARSVQAEVLDLFGDVHYAEVSAKTRQHLRYMLRTVCYALLRNSANASATLQIPDEVPPSEVLARSALPPYPGGPAPTLVSVPPMAPPPATRRQAPPQEQQQQQGAEGATAASPVGGAPVRSAGDSSDSLPPQPKKTPAPPGGTWRSTGAFSFDMAPTQFGSTGVFSPIEASDEGTSKPGGSGEGAPLHIGSGGGGADSPVDNSSTRLPTPRTSLIRPVHAEDVHLHLNGTAAAANRRAAPDPNEDLKARKEREQAEMKALLSRAGQRKGAGDDGAASGGAATGGSAAWLRSDADRMEDDVTGERDKAGDARSSSARPGMTSSLLDSLGVQGTDKAKTDRASDDEDGTRMHAQLKDRFAQIEHDTRQDTALARERAKRAKKQAKAESKCKCCVQ